MPEGRKEVSFDVHSRAAVESDGGVSYQVTVATLDWAAKKVKLVSFDRDVLPRCRRAHTAAPDAMQRKAKKRSE